MAAEEAEAGEVPAKLRTAMARAPTVRLAPMAVRNIRRSNIRNTRSTDLRKDGLPPPRFNAVCRPPPPPALIVVKRQAADRRLRKDEIHSIRITNPLRR
ncbi:hypothetical protein GCM10022293_36120 [Azospirillum formosense]